MSAVASPPRWNIGQLAELKPLKLRGRPVKGMVGNLLERESAYSTLKIHVIGTIRSRGPKCWRHSGDRKRGLWVGSSASTSVSTMSSSYGSGSETNSCTFAIHIKLPILQSWFTFYNIGLWPIMPMQRQLHGLRYRHKGGTDSSGCMYWCVICEFFRNRAQAFITSPNLSFSLSSISCLVESIIK